VAEQNAWGIVMKVWSTRKRLMTTSMIVGGVVAFSTSAYAQASGGAGPFPGASPMAEPDASGGSSGSTVQELVVTGSRIPQPNLTSVSPLTTVTSAEVRLNGTTNVEGLLNDLPSSFAAQTSQVSNGSDGTAQANLRNLGPTRTLVLVDGKRLMPGDPGSQVPDLNNIPAALVDRVDVVTGGASATYGSDAVAGVVNFIMKKNFEGVQVDYQYSFDNHQNDNIDGQQALKAFGLPIPKDSNGGGIHQVSIIMGANSPDDKGNITAYATYQHTDAILEGTRDFSDCGLATTTGPKGVANNHHICVGSSNSAYGRFDHVQTGVSATGAPIYSNLANNPNGTATFVPYTAGLAYNFNPLNFIQREDDRYNAGFFAHYDVNKMAEVYTDFMFTDDQTNAQIAPSGLFRNSGPNLSTGYTINCNNPLLSASQGAALCPGAVITPGAPGGSYDNLQSIGYRFASVPRNSDITHTDYKVDVGLRGDLGDGWSYDGYLQLGIARLDSHITGYASVSKVANALNVIDVNGVPTCVNGGSACVPLNIFTAQSAAITPAALNYVLADAFTTGESREQIASFNITGDLGHYGVKSPFAADGVGVNFGAEYRRESIFIDFDDEQQAGDLSGGGGQALPVSGSTNVKELFAEARVPLAHDLPFIEDLTLDAGYRFSHYNLAGDTNTYKIGGEWRPIEDVLIRASFNRAVRAPNVLELFAPNVTALATYVDPCASDTGTPTATLAQCMNTGLTAAQYGNLDQCPSAQCSARVGGTPTGLKPEVANTYTVGGVITPHFLPGLSMSVDYFNIKVNGILSTGVAPPTVILTECLANAASPFCALIHRDPVTGGLDTAEGYIVQTTANSGFLATDGIDAALNYRYHLPDWYRGASVGSLDLSFVGTWTDHRTIEPTSFFTPGSVSTYDCAGLYGSECGVPTPHFRTVTRVTWNTPWNLTASVRWRYNGPVSLDQTSPNPLLNSGRVDNTSNEENIHSYNYFDVAFTYKIKDGLILRTGMNNIFDLDPPIVDANNLGISGPPFGNGNTFPGFYDSLGRNIFVGLTANF
jgi:iron complex outermembrane receptor protein